MLPAACAFADGALNESEVLQASEHETGKA